MRILHLTLKKKWFDMILNGDKREEYRERKPYWDVRLKKEYDVVLFKNGYEADSPAIIVELKEISIGFGNVKWGAPENNMVYILKLGAVYGA